ncbi:MAG: FAD-binding oxidoreductase [Rubellimicrobium sp.]|nr:FAD-binding oxidoreductase [Rubellimicrobium sp.]
MRDFLIIGGGIAGVSAGARLAHLGQVTLLEAEGALAWHASGRSAALFEETYGKPAVVALNRASKDYHMTANGGVLGPRGLLMVGSTERAELFERDLPGMEMERIDTSEAHALVPILNLDVVDRAAFHPEAWDIDTDRLIQGFAREIRDSGGEIVTGARVTAIARTAIGWEVETSKGGYAARVLVNAAGAWVDQVAAMAGIGPLGFTPLRRSMARIAAPEGQDVAGWPMLFGAGEDWYAKPDAGALIVSPAEEDPSEPLDAWADDMVLAEGLARYEAHVTAPVTRMLANWAGLRTFAPDRQLVLGPSPQDPAFVWCAGQGGYGFQTAPAASALLADLVAGRQPELEPEVVAALDPARFGRNLSKFRGAP